jgi:hypothetical protein
MARARVSPEVLNSDSLRPQPAKASLRVSQPVSTGDDGGLGERIWLALERHHGSVKALSLALGVDHNQLRREVTRLNFAQFAGRYDDLAVINAEIQAVCAPLVTPQARIREQVRQIRRALDEVDQFVELIA